MNEDFISIRGAKVNNLKAIDVDIPRNQLVVITGVSGSGKSSLAFDTLYAEGQRRYVESLSSYARQFMGKISKPEVESIKRIPPAIAIEQRVISRNPRSTVGTTTEIYEYVKLLFARIGKTFSPISGKEVKRESTADVIQFILSQADSAKILVLAPFHVVSGRTVREQLEVFKKQGYNRVVFKKEIVEIDRLLQTEKKISINSIAILVDRFKRSSILEQQTRLSDSIESAFYEGKGKCTIQIEDETVKQYRFSHLFELDGMQFEKPSVNLFSFNNPYGACPTCGGLGLIDGIDPDLVIPNKTLSVFEGAVACWRGQKLSEWKNYFIRKATKIGFPPHRAIENLSEEEFDILWNGREEDGVEGVKQFFKFVESSSYKIQYRVILARYRGRTLCPDCLGTKLRKDANYVKVKGKSVRDILLMPIDELYSFFTTFKYANEQEKHIAEEIIHELQYRLKFLQDVGLGYLTLNRLSRSLSGGESQRINLATSLGNGLVGALYILDEPSIGLHARDTENLIKVLKRLRDIGNTVVVVEHDEEIIQHADYIIDIGPKAGRLGGEVVFQGTFENLLKEKESLTAAYLRGLQDPQDIDNLTIPTPTRRRKWRNYIEIIGAKENNLKSIDVKIPLEVLVVVTGVSGSGKSSLITNIMVPALQTILDEKSEKPGKFTKIDADFSKIKEVVMVDQNPIGRSSRSNPVTYVKAFTDIRDFFASQPLAKQRNYKSGFFSFNVPGGRCETCEGEGIVHISMQFMADVELVCDECQGKRFKDEVLDIKVEGYTITDLLNMTINQAIDFFQAYPKQSKLTESIIAKLLPLQEVGLGYLKMGQSSSTLSGGEAQRVKLAYYLSQQESTQGTLFVFDEPTIGLHFHDISKLYHSFNKLIEKGNSIVVIEHNYELIKCADWIIDLGPEGGEKGGRIVFEGTPEELVKNGNSHTAKFLQKKIVNI